MAAAASPSGETKELTPSQMDEAVRGAFADVIVEAKLAMCFDSSRLMMFGAYSKEKERAIDVYVESGVLPIDSVEYQYVARGYEMNGFMDNAAKEHFLSCMREALQQ